MSAGEGNGGAEALLIARGVTAFRGAEAGQQSTLSLQRQQL